VSRLPHPPMEASEPATATRQWKRVSRLTSWAAHSSAAAEGSGGGPLLFLILGSKRRPAPLQPMILFNRITGASVFIPAGVD
jgi:hypothetical protein